MSTALQQVHPSAAAPFFSSDQEKIILTTFLGGATKDEAIVLLETVRRRQLDPFSRQVYFVKRWDSAKREEVWAIQTSIDGLRSIAERTGKYDGQDEAEYGKDDHGEFAKVRVYRKDWSPGRAAVGVAYLAEFIQKKKDGTITAFWSRMPRLMLAKCAEALAIRKAFPEDTGGLYIAEEMSQEKDVTPHAELAKQIAAPPVALPPAPVVAAPPPPSPDPSGPKANTARIAAMWKRAVTKYGEHAAAEWESATMEALTENRLSKAWSDDDAIAVERVLFPEEDHDKGRT